MNTLVLGQPRELGTVGLVAGLVGGYIGVMVTLGTLFTTAADASYGRTAFALGLVSSLLVLVALYVAAVVIANCVDTVIAGRIPQIALLRLLGAKARDLRRAVMIGTARVGLLGALLGLLVGALLGALGRMLLVGYAVIPDLAYPIWNGTMTQQSGFGVLAVVLTATWAGWRGARAVLSVAPTQGVARAEAEPAAAPSSARGVVALLVGLFGVLLLGWAMALGESPTNGVRVLVAFAGAAVTGLGILIGARFVVPTLVRGAARVAGNSPASVIARRNAVKFPERTTRATLGLIIGVTLVTSIASGDAALRIAIKSWELDPRQQALADSVLTMTTAVLVGVLVISSIISAVGFVSTMSLTVIQRRREIGLLRAMGFTRGQVRSMITRESTALSAVAILTGVALGICFGSVGAQSLMGYENDGFIWGVPWLALALVAGAGVALVLVAARPPARRAVSVAPVEALRVS